MGFFKRLTQALKADHERLRQAAVMLELARVQDRGRRKQEWEASRILARHCANSAEFVLPFLIMTVIFTIHPPHGGTDEEIALSFLAHLYWFFGCFLSYFFVRYSLKWLFFFFYFRFGFRAFFLSAIVLFTGSTLMLIVGLDAVYPSTVPGAFGEGVPYVKLGVLMPAVIGGILFGATRSWGIYGHPFFSGTSGEQRFFALLPVGKRGQLVSVSADDHYVVVKTSKGTAHIRLKFADAMEMLQDSAGVRTHRSHWVSTNAIRDLHTGGDGKIVVTTLDGSEYLVAKSRLKDVKEHLAAAAGSVV